MLKPDCARRKSCQSAFGQGFDSPQLHQKGIGRTPISSAAASPRSVRSDPQQKSAVLEVIPRRRFLPHIILSDILLVFWRDMRPDRAVPAESSVQPGKGTDPVSTAERPPQRLWRAGHLPSARCIQRERSSLCAPQIIRRANRCGRIDIAAAETPHGMYGSPAQVNSGRIFRISSTQPSSPSCSESSDRSYPAASRHSSPV